MAKHRNIEIRGTVYADVADAARCLKISREAVYHGLKKGCLDRVGTGTTGVVPYPVKIADKTYDSVAAAAKALRMPPSRIYGAVIAGDPDRVVRPRRYNPARARAFTIGGRTYPSMRAAARELGFANEEYISKVVKRGSRRGWQRVLAAAMKLDAEQMPGGG